MRRIKADVVLAKIDRTGMTMKDWCEQAGIAQTTFSGWINNRRNVSKRSMAKLCQALGCTPNDITEIVYTIDPKIVDASRRQADEVAARFMRLTTEQKQLVQALLNELLEGNYARGIYD